MCQRPEYQAGNGKPASCRKIGPEMIFGRLWEKLGIADIIRKCAEERYFSFDIERAVYRIVMHRIFESGSDRPSLRRDDDFKLPLCCEMWPGNTADVSTIKEVLILCRCIESAKLDRKQIISYNIVCLQPKLS